MFIFPILFGAFQTTEPGPGGAAKVLRKDVLVTIKCVSQQIVLSGFGGRKAPISMSKMSTAEVLRLRAISAVSRNESARRFAQE